MIRIAIVEDDKEYQEQLVRYIKKYETEYGEEFKVCIFNDGDEIIEGYAGNYDIIFLDIEMKRLNGMDTARYIRKMDTNVILIFITNMSQYAIQGYEVEALDYVLKPIKYFAFSQELEKARKRLKSKAVQYLTISQPQGMVRLDTREILYLEKQGHNMIIHTEEACYMFRQTMKVMEEQLRGAQFVQCNSGYLVNLEHVKSVDKNLVHIGKSELQISRPRRREFMEALTNYLGKK